jgi:hypothetical protein
VVYPRLDQLLGSLGLEGRGERETHVCHIVSDVEGERSCDDTVGDERREEEMTEFGEGGLEDGEENGGHDEAEAVHLFDQFLVSTQHEEEETKEREGEGRKNERASSGGCREGGSGA